jgi:hypothetical protein
MICKTCHTEKLTTEFYVSNQSKCKECIKAAVKANRAANIGHYLAFDKARSGLPHRVQARASYRQTVAYAVSHAAAAIRWSEKHPERSKAICAVNNAVRDGRLKKHPCWVCGNKAHAHHPDYSQPLDVVWLCPAHHKAAHAAAGEVA